MPTPYWIEACALPRFPRLERNAEVDVVVVGGGATGLTAAWLLAAAGKSVALVERDRCARADTGHTSAHLTMVTDAPLSQLVRRFGPDHAQAVWDAGLAAIATIDGIVREHGIDCGFAWVEGFRHGPMEDPARLDPGELEKEARLAEELGFDAQLVDEGLLGLGPAVRYDGQARYQPRAFLRGLAERLVEAGGRIYEGARAEKFAADPLRVTVNGHTLDCGDVVIATHDPLVGVSEMGEAARFQSKLALYSSYVIAARVARGAVPDALYWDTSDPYHFLRLEPHRTFDVVVFGGEDHKTGQASDTAERYDRLERTLARWVPRFEVTHRWSGQVIDTPDGLPFLGRNAPHQYIATGFNGNGLTFGTVGAMIAADGILGRRNPWTELFSPERSAVRHGVWKYLRENADYPYYKIRDRFAGAEGRRLREVPRGEGRILQNDGAKMAVYRAPDGAVTRRSAACTHMGCTVAWNAAERSWDCPCHGSRFRPDGTVIGGPAESPLEKID